MSEEKLKLLTVKEAADKLERMSPYILRKMIKSGELPCVRYGRKIFIREDVLTEHFFGSDSAMSTVKDT